MSQNMLIKPLPSQTLLSFGISSIDSFFPGFRMGDFAVLHGTPSVMPLALLLSVRAQLPPQLGGLATNVIFVDGGNTFRLYKVSRIAQLHQLDPREVLERIYISRAFTAYQMTSVILEKLDETVDTYNSKLVIISDIAGLYLDKDVPAEEAKEVFAQLTAYLSKLAREKQVIVIATCLPHCHLRLSTFLYAVACGRANVVASIIQTKLGRVFAIEKHPSLGVECVEFSPDNHPLSQFVER